MRDDVARPRPGRKVGYHHFALFRGHLDGLALDRLGDLYLETGTDLRHAKRTLTWIRDELVVAAKRYQAETGVTQASLARLLRIEPDRLKPEERRQMAELPALEDFQAEVDPAGFYSEHELIVEFEKRFGGAGSEISSAVLRKAERNNRLRRRIRKAIDTLETWIATTPKASDPISIWLEPVVAQRLTPAGIVSIDDLVELINRRGHLWYRRIPKLGAVRAKRIVRWLQNSRVRSIEERSLIPHRQFVSKLAVRQHFAVRQDKSFGLVPLERLVLPSNLSGVGGTNRGSECQLASVRDDRDAIGVWLDFKGTNARTRRAYSSQVERFLLWLTLEKGRALSSASPEDCHEYIQFLKAVGTPGSAWPWARTRAEWTGPKAPRWSPDWKPFTGEIGERSQAMSITILKGMFVYLVDIGYLRWNPFAPVKVPKVAGQKIKIDHAFNVRQWAAIVEELDTLPMTEAYFRLQVALWLGYSCGPRLDEIIRLTVAHLQRTPEGDWNLVFVGKGHKEREIPLAKVVLGYLQDYFEVRGHGRNPVLWSKSLPLLTALGPELQKAQKQKDQPLAARSLSELFTRHFDSAAERLDDLIDAHELRQGSTHWLRHTAATTLIDKGASVTETQEILGHRSVATTSLYVHADRKKKRAAVERLFENPLE